MAMLRPQFTESLLENLKKRSVNVHGTYGQGQTRLLEDLKQLAQVQGFIVLSVDMKAWAEDYDGMIAEMGRQLRVLFPTASGQSNDFAGLINGLDNHASTTTVLLMLNRFDALLDNAVHLDDKYTAFFPHLNGFRNQQHRVLLTVSAKPYNRYRFYIDKIQNTSHLDLKLCEFRKLTHKEIKEELLRCIGSLSEPELALLTRTIHEHPQAYDFLEYGVEQITNGNDSDLSLNKRLLLWKKKLERSHKKSIWRQLDSFINWLTIAGKEINNLSLKLKILLATVSGLIAVLSGFLTPLIDRVKTLVD